MRRAHDAPNNVNQLPPNRDHRQDKKTFHRYWTRRRRPAASPYDCPPKKASYTGSWVFRGQSGRSFQLAVEFAQLHLGYRIDVRLKREDCLDHKRWWQDIRYYPPQWVMYVTSTAKRLTTTQVDQKGVCIGMQCLLRLGQKLRWSSFYVLIYLRVRIARRQTQQGRQIRMSPSLSDLQKRSTLKC